MSGLFWMFFFTILFFNQLKMMTLSQRKVVRREKTPLKVWNRIWRHREATLPLCRIHSTKLLCFFEEPWYCKITYDICKIQVFVHLFPSSVCAIHFMLSHMPYILFRSRYWPIEAATGPHCSVCARLCGIKTAESVLLYRALFRLKLPPLSQQSNWTQSLPVYWCWLLTLSWTC